MPLTRKFLDWTRPALVTAAEHLIGKHTSGVLVDLSRVVVVLPGGRAVRRMLEILVRLCDERSLVLAPPELVTAGKLPERLYRPKQRFATDLEQQLTWVRALKNHERAELAKIVRQVPPEEDIAAWLDLAGLLHKLHQELASELLNFESILNNGHNVPGFAEEERWQILAAVQDRYHKTLDGLQLWDKQTARRVAIEKRECETDCEIVLVGTVDLNDALRAMLDQVEQRSPGRVTALIFAPLDLTDRFDSHGCVLPDKWADARLEIPEEAILTAAGAAEQAEAVVRQIAAYNGRYRADEITIGVPDELLVPQIERLLAQCELPARWGPGLPLSRGGVFRFLEALGEYARRPRVDRFAALVRHPDVAAWLHRQGLRGDTCLTELDVYYNSHFPTSLGEEWLGMEIESQGLRPVYEALERLLAPLSGKMLPLREWMPHLVALLSAVYGERLLDRNVSANRYLLAGCKKICDMLHEIGELVPEVSPTVPASVAIELALEQIRNEAIPPPADEEAIELLGWLELPLDDAPAVVVTSFNDGFVPQAINSDLFLPNALRTKLNLDDNARRYARGAYALSLLLASRRDLKLIVARRDTEKNPLAPSRLLFATEAETIARRALKFFEPRGVADGGAPLAGAWRAGRETSGFERPLPQRLAEPLAGLNVTAFKMYLSCPYRFYLSRVLRLAALDDSADELDGGAFGNIMHTVLQRFGLSDERDSTDAEKIAALLRHELNQCVADTFGKRPAAAIAIQAEQMRARLEALAPHQARRAAEGWRIEHVEPEGLQWQWEVDGRPFLLVGRIDRIDQHELSGRRAILDYKTSDSGLPPRKTHQKGDAWVDLQLPLYRYLAQGLGLPGPFQLGYVLLPKDISKTKFEMADWDEAELAVADDIARDVVRGVRGQVFWPPTEPPPDFSEELAPICQDGVYKGRPA